jgi:hypothetical protein
MASTRNKNTASDYRVEQLQNLRYKDRQCSEDYLGNTACYSGNGLGGGRIHGQFLAHNYIEIESDLRGIAYNLVDKREKVVPKLISLKTLALYQGHNHSQDIIYPAPLIVNKYNRPFY